MDRAPGFRAGAAAFACGLALGALPFAKVQAVPIAAVGLAAAVVVAARRRLREPKRGASPAFALVAGLFVVPLATIALVAANGVLGDAVTSYILMPLAYDRSIAPQAASFGARPNLGFILFERIGTIGSALMLVAAALLERRRPEGFNPRSSQWIAPLVALLALFAADYAVARPRSDYVHYLLWFVVPIVALFGSAAGILLDACARSFPARRLLSPVLALAIALVATVPATWYRLQTGYPLYASFAQDLAPPKDPVLTMLQGHIRKGERIAVWGWMPEFYVATGALLGTRDAITQFQIVPSSYRNYYRRRYLSDFALSRPHFFVDAVSSSTFAYHDRATEGHESFPELERIVSADYREIDESYGVRLYERKP